MVITAQEYRQMAEECFGWAREAQTDEVRLCYLNLAQTWLEAAAWIADASGQHPQTPSPLTHRPAPRRKAA
jgi:hypothetical protein